MDAILRVKEGKSSLDPSNYHIIYDEELVGYSKLFDWTASLAAKFTPWRYPNPQSMSN